MKTPALSVSPRQDGGLHEGAGRKGTPSSIQRNASGSAAVPLWDTGKGNGRNGKASAPFLRTGVDSFDAALTHAILPRDRAALAVERTPRRTSPSEPIRNRQHNHCPNRSLDDRCYKAESVNAQHSENKGANNRS